MAWESACWPSWCAWPSWCWTPTSRRSATPRSGSTSSSGTWASRRRGRCCGSSASASWPTSGLGPPAPLCRLMPLAPWWRSPSSPSSPGLRCPIWPTSAIAKARATWISCTRTPLGTPRTLLPPTPPATVAPPATSSPLSPKTRRLPESINRQLTDRLTEVPKVQRKGAEGVICQSPKPDTSPPSLFLSPEQARFIVVIFYFFFNELLLRERKGGPRFFLVFVPKPLEISLSAQYQNRGSENTSQTDVPIKNNNKITTTVLLYFI